MVAARISTLALSLELAIASTFHRSVHPVEYESPLVPEGGKPVLQSARPNVDNLQLATMGRRFTVMLFRADVSICIWVRKVSTRKNNQTSFPLP